MPRTITAEQLPDLLRPGMTVFVQGASGEPTPLLRALAAAPAASAGVHYVGCLIPGLNLIDPASFHPDARLTSFFVAGAIAKSHAAGRVRFLPLHYSGIWQYLSGLAVDLALIQVTPPDDRGRCSLGVSVHFVPAVLARAKLVVAEINAAMPRPRASFELPYERLDYATLTERPVLELPAGGLSDDVRKVGANVASLIEDGDVIQIGIGKVPAAVLSALHDRRGLGLHGGLIADGIADLYAAGAIGRMVCTASIGTAKIYDFAATCPDLAFAPVSHTHDQAAMAAIPNFVAINSVLSVDLTGQANAEMLDGRQVSGTGGLLDFVRGAHASPGGRSILALPSTAAGGKLSRIVVKLGVGDIVSCPRADADIVVTEHGVARLRDKSLEERAEALIGVAAPGFREELAKGRGR